MRCSLLLVLLVGCASASPSLRAELNGAAPARDETPSVDGSLASYVALAMHRSSRVEAAYERWHASVERVGAAARMPDPVVTYAFYARPVQTRVGPQNHRVGVRQGFLAPGVLSAANDAAEATARAAQQRFEAEALMVRSQVASAFWRLWQIDRARTIRREQLNVLETLAEALRGRVEAGQVSVSELMQLDLRRARRQDELDGLEEQERAARAQLEAALGAEIEGSVDASDAELNAIGELSFDEDMLAQIAADHPLLESYRFDALSAEASARARRASRRPTFSLGAEWIITGTREDTMTPVANDGDDALIVSLGMSVPIFGGAEAAGARAAEAEANASRATRQALEDEARGRVAVLVARLRDAQRRARLFEATLIPQAVGVYESMSSAYVIGQTTLASTMLAAEELLALQLGQLEVQVSLGVLLAELEQLLGRAIPSRSDINAREASADQ